MTGLVVLLRRAWREIQSNIAAIALGLAALGMLVAAPSRPRNPCRRQSACAASSATRNPNSINFLMYQAKGENEEMAANAVNKEIAKASCAYYLPADAIYTGEHTVMRDGLVFKLHSYVFLPEQVERWSGSVLGSLQQSPYAKHDV